METTIKVHPKSASYNIVTNATPAMIAEANKLVAGNWAKISETTITVHVNHLRKFQNLMPKAEKHNHVRAGCCEFCGAKLEESPDGSKFCPKFCE